MLRMGWSVTISSQQISSWQIGVQILLRARMALFQLYCSSSHPYHWCNSKSLFLLHISTLSQDSLQKIPRQTPPNTLSPSKISGKSRP